MRTEFRKARRKPTLLLLLAVVGINLCYLFIGIKKNDIAGIPQPWEAVLFYIPLINSLFLSVLMAVLASRSMELDHKGAMWNLLSTLQTRRKIYFGKILYGLVWLLVFGLLELGTTVGLAKWMGFPGFPPLRAVALTLLGETLGALVIYLMQLLLSLVFSGQFTALAVNLCGTLGGFFLMYADDRILTPWSLMGALRVLNMDFQAGDAFSIYTWYNPPASDWLAALAYLGGLLVLGLWLLSRVEEGSLTILSRSIQRSGSVRTRLSAERIKLKHSPLWIAFALMPVISSLIGVFNFSVNQGTLHFTWENLWTQQSLFLGLFFLSPLVGIFCSYLWRMEHVGTNWNILLTLESPARIVKDKLVSAGEVSGLCVLWVGVLFIISGKVIGIENEIPLQFYESMLCGVFACLAVASMQLYLSLIIRSFAVPVGVALAGGLAGLLLLSRNCGFALPYAMLQMGLRSTNLTNEVNVPLFLAVSCFYVLGFFALSVFYIRRCDVKTQE